MSKESDKKPDRPPITELHKTFYKRVVLAAQYLADVAVQRAIARVGVHPPELTRGLLPELATLALDFRGSGQPRQHSRAIEGSIAGSDFFTFNSIKLSDEGTPGYGEKANPAFAGRLLFMTLLYGGPKLDDAHLWRTRVYTGQGTPPVFVNEEAARKFLVRTRPEDGRLSDLWRLQENLPEKAFHYPTSEELTIVLKGLHAAQADVDYSEIIGRVDHYVTDQLEFEQDSPPLTDDVAWLAAAKQRLGPFDPA